MMKSVFAVLLCLAASQSAADTLIAAHTLRAQTVIGADDVTLASDDVAGALSEPSSAIGKETRRAVYQGKPVFPEDVGPAALLTRNQRTIIQYRSGGLTIAAEGRALERGVLGDAVHVMNMTSHMIVVGVVEAGGKVQVGQ